jgi:Na+-driven multidrug efflux pump
VPLGFLAAFVLKLPVAPVYFLLSLEECVRLALSLRLFKKRSWMQQL